MSIFAAAQAFAHAYRSLGVNFAPGGPTVMIPAHAWGAFMREAEREAEATFAVSIWADIRKSRDWMKLYGVLFLSAGRDDEARPTPPPYDESEDKPGEESPWPEGEDTNWARRVRAHLKSRDAEWEELADDWKRQLHPCPDARAAAHVEQRGPLQ